MDSAMRTLLERQQYRFAGEHSAVKVCHWTKQSLLGRDTCYKERFYGIRAHRCVQMSPTVGVCQNNCVHCWRETQHSLGNALDNAASLDAPADIVERSIAGQRKLLAGFGGNTNTDKGKFAEAQEPLHFAISLSGEPTAYPLLGELIEELGKRNLTSFLVTNGMLPDRLAALKDAGHLPTQFYLSLNATGERQFRELCRPFHADGWQRLGRSMGLVREMRGLTRTTVRITAIRGLNMADAEGWAAMLGQAHPLFVEVKAYMFVGSSRERLTLGHMPSHSEVREFAQRICGHCGYRIIDEKPESRVVLLMEQDIPGRRMAF